MAKKKFFEKKEDEVEVKEEIQEETTEQKQEKEETIEQEKPSKKNKNSKIGMLVNCELLNAREEPNKNSKILFVINSKDTIEILDEDDDFYKIVVNGKEAYCMKNFIKIK